MVIVFEPTQATYDALQNRLDKLGKGDAMREVMTLAINDTAEEIKERMHSETKARYAIKEEVYRKGNIRRRKALEGKLESTLKIKGPTLSIWEGYPAEENDADESTGARAMVLNDGVMKELNVKENGHTYKAFLATMKSGHTGIFRRRNKPMQEKNCPRPTERIHKKPRKARESITEIIALSRSKAVEIAYRKEVEVDVMPTYNFRLLQHMNEVVGGLDV